MSFSNTSNRFYFDLTELCMFIQIVLETILMPKLFWDIVTWPVTTALLPRTQLGAMCCSIACMAFAWAAWINVIESAWVRGRQHPETAIVPILYLQHSRYIVIVSVLAGSFVSL
jgi:hypothetical protein